MLDVMRYRANLDALSLKELNENNKFLFNNAIANDKFKSL